MEFQIEKVGEKTPLKLVEVFCQNFPANIIVLGQNGF
jgi:hypothetical protein